MELPKLTSKPPRQVFVAIAVVSLAVLAAGRPEPPSPRSNYLPPNQNGNNGYNYNANDNSGYNYPSAPSSQYGAPSGAGGSGAGANGYNYADANANAEPAKYSFEYDVKDYQSGNDFGHMESRDGDRTVGRYYVLLPDGRKQVSRTGLPLLYVYKFLTSNCSLPR